MLKLPHEEDERLGGVLMEWWEGDGAARVLARNIAALLLERTTGTASLADMARSERTIRPAASCAAPQRGCTRRVPSRFQN